jgi:hypothetical protein
MEAQQWQDRNDELHELRRRIGMDEEGWVPAEDFKATYRRYRKVRKEWISEGHLESDWPFSGPIVDEGEMNKAGSLTSYLRRLFGS